MTGNKALQSFANVLEIRLDDLMTFPETPTRKTGTHKYPKRVIKALYGKNDKIKSTAVKVLEEVCGVESAAKTD